MRKWLLALVAVLAGCAQPSTPQPAPSPPAPPAEPVPYQCILPSEQRMLVAELFFGRMSQGRLAVSDAAWDDFLKSVVTPNFPDGLTVFDGYGQWRDPASGVIGRSRGVKIVLVAVKRAPDVPGRLTAVMDAYRERFHQKSVGLMTRDSCAAF